MIGAELSIPAVRATPEAVQGAQFQWSAALDGAAIERVDDVMSELIDEVGTICQTHLPKGRRYRWRSEQDRGLVAGRRFIVQRRGFRGTVSVLWYARSPSYRTAKRGEIEVRIGGRVRLLPRPAGLPRPELDPHTSMRALGLVVALGLAVAGLQGLFAVRAHPSLMFLFDAIGNAGSLLLLVAAIALAITCCRDFRLRLHPRPVGAPAPDRYGPELSAWRRLEEAVTRIDPRALTAAEGEPTPRGSAAASPRG